MASITVLSAIVLIVLSFCMSSCGFVSFVERMGSERREKVDIVEFDDGEKDVIKDPDTEKTTIPKAQSHESEPGNYTSAGQAYNSVSEVYYAVADSVVEITTETVRNSLFMGQYISEGAGSGVIIDGSGLIVTNNHVIAGANNVTVRLTDGSEYKATFIGKDEAADLAVIKIDADDKELKVASLGCSEDLIVGEDVIAIGNPLGSLGGTLTTGIISATERNIYIDGEEKVLLQTNAAINPGNSGGGLFNMAGELVGVVNAKASGEDIEGLGFAIPVDYAHGVIEDLINYGYVRGIVDHGLITLDVNRQNLPYAYQKYGITSIGVVVIDSAYSGEFAYGDVIVSIDDVEISSSEDIDLLLKEYCVGDTITVRVERDGKKVAIELTLHEKVPDSVSFE